MDGIINIYKEAGMTSFSCVAQVRKITQSEKAGHAGTLDPQATGVLPVLLGKATRCSDLFLELPKRYRGEITFGIETDTCDIWGQPAVQIPPCDPALEAVCRDSLQETIGRFTGEIEQLPPAYAAVKINGVPAYKLARRGKPVELRSRTVTIYRIELLRFTRKEGEYPKAVVDVTCSRGTYIRSLCRDIGRQLGVCACMSALERTEYGPLKKDTALTLQQLRESCGGETDGFPYDPVDRLLQEEPYIILNAEEEKRYRTGVSVRFEDPYRRLGRAVPDGARLRVYTESGRFLATAWLLLHPGEIVRGELKLDKFFDCEGVLP